jgi:cytochrome c oxidase assembly protein Cox11
MNRKTDKYNWYITNTERRGADPMISFYIISGILVFAVIIQYAIVPMYNKYKNGGAQMNKRGG